jgi:prepilin-type N-terminal cleavage/methylation domain-containing protein
MRLKGFTILEILIAMVLFGIITGLGSSSYLFVSKQFLDYKKTDDVVKAGLTLEALLSRDFTESYSVKNTNEDLTCFYTEKDPVLYKLKAEYIIRIQQNQPDTFKIPALNIKMALDNKPTEKNSLINLLSFTTKISGKDMQLNFSKLYGADLLMELETKLQNGNTY